MPPAQPINAWHGCNWAVFLPVMNKYWENEVSRGQMGLRECMTDSGAASIPPWPRRQVLWQIIHSKDGCSAETTVCLSQIWKQAGPVVIYPTLRM